MTKLLIGSMLLFTSCLVLAAPNVEIQENETLTVNMITDSFRTGEVTKIPALGVNVFMKLTIEEGTAIFPSSIVMAKDECVTNDIHSIWTMDMEGNIQTLELKSDSNIVKWMCNH